MDAVTEGIAENEHFHKMVVDLIQKTTGRTLIIVERISHGDRLQELITDSVWVRGKDDVETRKYVIDRLKKDENVVAIATSKIFDVGINCFIHNLVNCAGGNAHHVLVQRFGRGLRVSSDKEKLFYYDFIFEINDYLERHSKNRIKILEKEGHKIEILS
jgi:superfamily II DNA or RNA helicase